MPKEPRERVERPWRRRLLAKCSGTLEKSAEAPAVAAPAEVAPGKKSLVKLALEHSFVLVLVAVGGVLTFVGQFATSAKDVLAMVGVGVCYEAVPEGDHFVQGEKRPCARGLPTLFFWEDGPAVPTRVETATSSYLSTNKRSMQLVEAPTDGQSTYLEYYLIISEGKPAWKAGHRWKVDSARTAQGFGSLNEGLQLGRVDDNVPMCDKDSDRQLILQILVPNPSSGCKLRRSSDLNPFTYLMTLGEHCREEIVQMHYRWNAAESKPWPGCSDNPVLRAQATPGLQWQPGSRTVVRIRD